VPRNLFLFVALLLALASGGAAAELKEGRDYAAISPPQPTLARGKVEVIEFFWYGCPHCYDFEPVLNKWLKTKPQDVVFRRIPALFPSGRWAPAVKLFYALEAIGEEDRVHGALFDAIHVERMDYTSEAKVTDWLAQKGVDRRKFAEAYNSQAVQDKLKRAQEMTQAYGITGVPTVVIAGKYQTSNTLAGSHEVLPEIMDQLIVKVRAEQQK
jgi:protein dithiol oxidoreductase (disulfide-forming)